MKRRVAYLIALALPTAALAQTNTVGAALRPTWQTCTGSEQGLIIVATAIVTFLGLVFGWVLFPLTVAPIRYIMESELDIWGARLAMSLAGGGIAGFLVFNFLVEYLAII